MEMVQIKGVDSTKRETKADLKAGARLIVRERLMTHGEQFAHSVYNVTLDGDGSSADVKCIMVGNDGQTYKQDYIGISPIDGSDFNYRFVMDNSHIVFE